MNTPSFNSQTTTSSLDILSDDIELLSGNVSTRSSVDSLVEREPIHWLFHIGDGNNFKQTSARKLWSCYFAHPWAKHFIKNAQAGDIMWFIQQKTNGKPIAVATFSHIEMRDHGPLIDLTPTNEELGWTNDTTKWTSDRFIHYTELYDLSRVTDGSLCTQIRGTSTIRKYSPEKCAVDLPNEYVYITRYGTTCEHL
jgi:hypothetical protein